MLKKAAAFVIILAAFSLAGTVGAVSAKAYALVDGASGRLVCGSNENTKMPMASTTKIMTALIACESQKLDETITVNPQALRVEGTSMGLLPDERLTLRDLVYGLLLESGNDAANAIAYELGGSIEGFAAMMNERAVQLNLTNTHFANPSGLDADGHYTTALDLARLGAYAMKNPDFAAVAGTKKMKIPYNGMKNGRTLYNHNRLLGSYDGMNGIKTGFTKKSGRCLVTSATRNGISLVVATLSASDDWDDHKYLLDYGFGILKNYPVLKSTPNIVAKVVGGTFGSVAAEYNPSVTAALLDGEESKVQMQVELPAFLYAPVKKGQKIGEIVFTVDGNVCATDDLIATRSVPLQARGIIKATGVGPLPFILVGGGVAFIGARYYMKKRKEPKEVKGNIREK